jgi:phage terminase Nu1 subunit (DNA packaging protein)
LSDSQFGIVTHTARGSRSAARDHQEIALQSSQPDISFFSSGNGTMRKFVAHLNIDHYREILAVETDGEKRKVIEKLLADAEAELTAAKEKDRQQKAH